MEQEKPQTTEAVNFTVSYKGKDGVRYKTNVKAKNFSEALTAFAKAIPDVEEIFGVTPQKAEPKAEAPTEVPAEAKAEEPKA